MKWLLELRTTGNDTVGCTMVARHSVHVGLWHFFPVAHSAYGRITLTTDELCRETSGAV